MTLIRLLFHIALLIVSMDLRAQSGEQFTIANTLQSNMVIQQQKPLILHGKAKASSRLTITVSWSPQKFQAVAGADNSWRVEIPVPAAKSDNFQSQSISVKMGSREVSLTNVLIGDVWLCSGQSNMDMELKPFLPWLLGAMHYQMEIENANYPQIRLFNVRTDFTRDPQDDCGGKWTVCSPATAPDFSALAYFFARELFHRRRIPMGLVVSSVGASSCQAWTSRDTLAADPVLHQKYLFPYDTSIAAKEKLDSVVTFEKVVMPTLFYNAMIHPLKNLGFRGALWYQGESNRFDSSLYTRLCAAMVRNWRDLFRTPDLPFYYVQVAPYNWQQNDTTAYQYALLREAQSNIRNVLDHTEMAITMDIADPTDIHPRNKQDLGYRLAKIALAGTYGEKGVHYRGPEYESHVIEDDLVKVRFVTNGSALATNDGLAPRHFYVAGKDGVFHYADATINGREVWLRSARVREPVAVRYAFTDYPVTNFCNAEGFPADPFRSSF